jgi:hypothetical protein
LSTIPPAASHQRLAVRLLLAGVILIASGFLFYRYVAAAGCGAAASARPCVRILFIGNSLTFGNDLPGMVAGLAMAGGHRVETAMLAEGGWKLADHAAAARTAEVIAGSPWQYVVLQEQSQLPSVEALRTGTMYPAARALARSARAAGATPLFYQTWARRDGWPERGLRGYQQMQTQVNRGYAAIAEELGAPIAPAGEAWRVALRRVRGLRLWEDDGIHATAQGTYLAACVFYAAFFGESPEGLAYTAGLPKETAAALQRVAGEVVLGSPQRWNLPPAP